MTKAKLNRPPKKNPHKGEMYRGMGINRPDERGQQALRKCLSCSRDFWSEHRGNRMCGRCAIRLDGVPAS